MKRGRGSRQEGRSDWLYGRRPVLETLRAGRRLVYEAWLAVSNERQVERDDELVELQALCHEQGINYRPVTRDELDRQLRDVNHQGVALRVAGYPHVDIKEILKLVADDPAALVLVLDHIEDPQNVGSLLRTADAAGVVGVVIPQDRASGVTAAAVRASAGAAEHLRVARVVNLVRALEQLKQAGCWVTGLEAGDGARDYTALDLKGRVAVVVGNEGAGLGRLVRENCDFVAALPMLGRVSSLNAGVAGALLMYEVLRQRATAGAQAGSSLLERGEREHD
jgi:23S rRNA (guanosine2251-2'-O)-methyltransferase